MATAIARASTSHGSLALKNPAPARRNLSLQVTYMYIITNVPVSGTGAGDYMSRHKIGLDV